MELKVWVDGIQRVVCGVSEQTSCQEVVVALARALGQTGRYVLIQKLRGKERQLLPHECPVATQAQCGQSAHDVQLVLRRTGPSPAERAAAVPVEARPAGRAAAPAPTSDPGAPVPTEAAELVRLERLVRRNEAELGEEAFWQGELRQERARERQRQETVRGLRASTRDYVRQLRALAARARALEEELHRARAPAPGPPAPLEDMACRMRRDLEDKVQQSSQLRSNLADVGRALEAAERSLQVQTQELEDLNKELRQCNLQQFIQQTGATATACPPPGPAPAPHGNSVVSTRPSAWR
ncbi:ras association domain-containing protein 7 [Tachyglossus aculeatus]|uniref:ras association domain-containing protein 7 n=1 Tax=Tachyglossus aculeatus TaxID=9261 RepID=UPI0018F4DA1F|nr:ras association domain-containing protein 7 [Tachyglossus aculeatus]